MEVFKVDGVLSLTNGSEEIRLQDLGFKAWSISFLKLDQLVESQIANYFAFYIKLCGAFGHFINFAQGMGILGNLSPKI